MTEIVSTNDLADAQLDDRIAELDAAIFRALADRHEANLVMGRAFNKQKEILGYGRWQKHFEELFASQISLRTAERYMRRAREADEESKNDKVSIFKLATDRGAEEIRAATERSQEEVGASSSHNKMKELLHIYMLPLRMSGNEKDAMDTLQTLPDWPHIEKRIVRRLRRYCVEYGVVHEGDL